MLHSLAARPRSPTAAAFSSKSFPRQPGPRSRIVPVPATQPPRGLSPSQRRGCPALRAAHAPQSRDNPPLRSTEARLQSLRLLTPILCENQAAKPRPDKSQARPSYRRPRPPILRRLPGALQRLKEKREGATGSLLFRSTRRDFTYAVQGLLVRSSLRSTLSRSGVIVRPLLRSAGGFA